MITQELLHARTGNVIKAICIVATLLAGSLLRAGIILFVGYEDIDYRIINHGYQMLPRSPYLVDTYRYTPLLAYYEFDLTFFSAFDILVTLFLVFIFNKTNVVNDQISQNYGSSDTAEIHAEVAAAREDEDQDDSATEIKDMELHSALRLLLLEESREEAKNEISNEFRNVVKWLFIESHYKFIWFVWLFNPFVFTISTRGNADCIHCFFILLFIYFLSQRQLILSSICYGFVVHLRIFPIIFAPTMLIYFFRGGGGGFQRRENFIKHKIANLTDAVMFSVMSGGFFLLLALVFYIKYGWPFLYETYLYHFVRKDHRHNFSLYFYDIYLKISQDMKDIDVSQILKTDSGGKTGGPSSIDIFSIVLFLPQLLIQLIIAYRFAIPSKRNINDIRPLGYCFCIQTMAFVAFNKVITAQYFVWYLCLLPISLSLLDENEKTRINIQEAVYVLAFWIIAQLNWLFWGFQLEFRANQVFFQVFLSGIFFFVANIQCISLLIIKGTRSELLKVPPIVKLLTQSKS